MGLPAIYLTMKELEEKFPESYNEFPPNTYKRFHIIPETLIVDEHYVHVYASWKNT